MSKEFVPSKFLKDLSKNFGESAIISCDSAFSIEDADWYSTGSMSLDMQMNGGHLNLGGVASGRVTVFAGPESSGKTFFAVNVVKDFLSRDENNVVVCFDSESNLTKNTFLNAGIEEKDLDRIVIDRVMTLEKFRTDMVRTYHEAKESGAKIFVVLDSLGGLIPEKVVEEATSKPNEDGVAEVKASVGRPQQIIKQTIGLMEHYAGQINSPALIISHVYDTIGSMYPSKTVAGGSGVKYFNSNIVEFSKAQSKEKSDTIHDINGIIITSKLLKSRFARELTKVRSLINFNTGVERYYGLVTFLETFGLITKDGVRYLIEKDSSGNPTGKKYWAKELAANDYHLIKQFLPELERHTIHNFGIGKLSMSTELKVNDLKGDEIVVDFDRLIETTEGRSAKTEES